MKVKSRKITFRLTPSQEGRVGHLLNRGAQFGNTWSEVIREALVALAEKFPAERPIRLSDTTPAEKLPLFEGKKRATKKVVAKKPARKAGKKMAS